MSTNYEQAIKNLQRMWEDKSTVTRKINHVLQTRPMDRFWFIDTDGVGKAMLVGETDPEKNILTAYDGSGLNPRTFNLSSGDYWVEESLNEADVEINLDSDEDDIEVNIDDDSLGDEEDDFEDMNNEDFMDDDSFDTENDSECSCPPDEDDELLSDDDLEDDDEDLENTSECGPCSNVDLSGFNIGESRLMNNNLSEDELRPKKAVNQPDFTPSNKKKVNLSNVGFDDIKTQGGDGEEFPNVKLDKNLSGTMNPSGKGDSKEGAQRVPGLSLRKEDPWKNMAKYFPKVSEDVKRDVSDALRYLQEHPEENLDRLAIALLRGRKSPT